MRKQISILGSTGSIGKTLLKIIEKNKKDFNVVLLTANKNYKILLSQARKFKVKNLIITNKKSYLKLKKLVTKLDINVFNNYENFNKIFKKKNHYVMSSIIGLEGLYPTLKIIKFTKKIVIANKESIICGWNLIKIELDKYKTEFIPVDSEHFSIWHTFKHNNFIEKIILTASGGPFNKLPISKFNKIKIFQALNHPNWKMGKKITIDSSTMMNKVFEIIEAKKLFNVDYENLSILIHPNSYVHAIVKFKDGVIQIIAHDTDMKIPIHNTLYSDEKKSIYTKQISVEKLNNLDFQKINKKKFPLVNILKIIPSNHSLFETILVSANDEFVRLFLNKSIKFNDISKNLLRFIKKKEFVKYKRILPSNIDDILSIDSYVKSKINLKFKK